MYFSFKTTPDDFIVKEILDFNLDGIGDFFYILFEKKSTNTMDIINPICKNFNIKRENLGITGLKDKDGITQQWISISKRTLNSCGGHSKLLSFLNDKVSIIQTGRHTTPLAVGKNKGNLFTIRLRKKSDLPENLKDNLEKNLIGSRSQGFPNIFGYQRFGKGNKNYKKVLQIFSGEEKTSQNYEVKFKFQVFGSLWFNEYVMKRWEENKIILDGDIMVNGWNAFGTKIASLSNNRLQHFDYWKEKEDIVGKSFWEPKSILWESDYNPSIRIPTGPVLGAEQLLCRTGTQGRIYDNYLLKTSKFLEGGDKILKQFKIYGYRRPLWTIPQDLKWDRDNGDLILSFFLPTGCYASSFLAFILKNIDPKGCESNNLKILRASQL